MSQKNIASLFNKFAGKEVQVIKSRLAASNPVVDELKQAAEDAGLILRLWLPGTVGTRDYRTDRLNAHVNKEADGKYRIASDFDIG